MAAARAGSRSSTRTWISRSLPVSMVVSRARRFRVSTIVSFPYRLLSWNRAMTASATVRLFSRPAYNSPGLRNSAEPPPPPSSPRPLRPERLPMSIDCMGWSGCGGRITASAE